MPATIAPTPAPEPVVESSSIVQPAASPAPLPISSIAPALLPYLDVEPNRNSRTNRPIRGHARRSAPAALPVVDLTDEDDDFGLVPPLPDFMTTEAVRLDAEAMEILDHMRHAQTLEEYGEGRLRYLQFRHEHPDFSWRLILYTFPRSTFPPSVRADPAAFGMRETSNILREAEQLARQRRRRTASPSYQGRLQAQAYQLVRRINDARTDQQYSEAIIDRDMFLRMHDFDWAPYQAMVLTRPVRGSRPVRRPFVTPPRPAGDAAQPTPRASRQRYSVVIRVPPPDSPAPPPQPPQP